MNLESWFRLRGTGPKRKLAVAIALAAFVVPLVISTSVSAAERVCFVPKKGSKNDSSSFVDPKSNVCRAFQRELNANCGGDIPTIEFKPRLPDSGITEPAWEPVPLFTSSGNEDQKSFALLERLIWARAVTQFIRDKEALAKRDVELILGQVRAAHASGKVPRFDRVSLDLEGRGRQELLYRLYSGLAQNARSRNDEDSSFKTEPNLFLDRAARFASSDEASKISSSAAGGQLTIKTADVLMFGGAPYLFTWDAGFGVLVYDAYSRRDRPYIPEEKIEGHTFILPTLRCIFESRPTH